MATNADDDPPPGVKRWLVSCDESGVNGTRFYAFGSLWMGWQRRGEFNAAMEAIRAEHGYLSEIKWTKVKPQFAEMYVDLVEMFFKEPSLSFQCVLVEKSVVRKDLHPGGFDEARRKHLTMLLTDKVKACMRAHPSQEQTFRIWTDPIHSRQRKAHEVVEIVANHALRRAFGGQLRPVDSVIERDSRDTPSIQLCDVLLGAVASAWEGDVTAEAKLDLQQWMAHHLGWQDLKGSTVRQERKFNVWVFYDPTSGPRKVQARPVDLVYPLPARAAVRRRS